MPTEKSRERVLGWKAGEEQWILSYRSQNIWVWAPRDINNRSAGKSEEIRASPSAQLSEDP